MEEVNRSFSKQNKISYSRTRKIESPNDSDQVPVPEEPPTPLSFQPVTPGPYTSHNCQLPQQQNEHSVTFDANSSNELVVAGVVLDIAGVMVHSLQQYEATAAQGEELFKMSEEEKKALGPILDELKLELRKLEQKAQVKPGETLLRPLNYSPSKSIRRPFKFINPKNRFEDNKREDSYLLCQEEMSRLDEDFSKLDEQSLFYYDQYNQLRKENRTLRRNFEASLQIERLEVRKREVDFAKKEVAFNKKQINSQNEIYEAQDRIRRESEERFNSEMARVKEEMERKFAEKLTDQLAEQQKKHQEYVASICESVKQLEDQNKELEEKVNRLMEEKKAQQDSDAKYQTLSAQYDELGLKYDQLLIEKEDQRMTYEAGLEDQKKKREALVAERSKQSGESLEKLAQEIRDLSDKQQKSLNSNNIWPKCPMMDLVHEIDNLKLHLASKWFILSKLQEKLKLLCEDPPTRTIEEAAENLVRQYEQKLTSREEMITRQALRIDDLEKELVAKNQLYIQLQEKLEQEKKGRRADNLQLLQAYEELQGQLDSEKAMNVTFEKLFNDKYEEASEKKQEPRYQFGHQPQFQEQVENFMNAIPQVESEFITVEDISPVKKNVRVQYSSLIQHRIQEEKEEENLLQNCDAVEVIVAQKVPEKETPETGERAEYSTPAKNNVKQFEVSADNKGDREGEKMKMSVRSKNFLELREQFKQFMRQRASKTQGSQKKSSDQIEGGSPRNQLTLAEELHNVSVIEQRAPKKQEPSVEVIQEEVHENKQEDSVVKESGVKKGENEQLEGLYDFSTALSILVEYDRKICMILKVKEMSLPVKNLRTRALRMAEKYKHLIPDVSLDLLKEEFKDSSIPNSPIKNSFAIHTFEVPAVDISVVIEADEQVVPQSQKKNAEESSQKSQPQSPQTPIRKMQGLDSENVVKGTLQPTSKLMPGVLKEFVNCVKKFNQLVDLHPQLQVCLQKVWLQKMGNAKTANSTD